VTSPRTSSALEVTHSLLYHKAWYPWHAQMGYELQCQLQCSPNHQGFFELRQLLSGGFWLLHPKWVELLFLELSMSQWLGRIIQRHKLWLDLNCLRTLSRRDITIALMALSTIVVLFASDMVMTTHILTLQIFCTFLLNHYYFHVYLPQPKIVACSKFLDIPLGTRGGNLIICSDCPKVGGNCCEFISKLTLPLWCMEQN
jgi:hypothetical protein